ncbi:MAG TPA: cupredoxin domain-containing protein [Thermoplasmata archaeon]
MRNYESDFRGKAVFALEMMGLTLIIGAALTIPFSVNATAADVSITIGDNFFSPASQTVFVGDRVIWTNTGGNIHTVTSTTPAGILDSGNIASGNTYEFTFATEGTFNYRCIYHPMTGSITVISVIPEFQSGAFVAAGMVIMLLGLVLARRRL